MEKDVLETAKSTGKNVINCKIQRRSKKKKYFIHLYIILYIHLYVLHKEKIRFVMNEAAKGIRTIFLAQEFRWHFSFNIALNFARILSAKRKKKKVICN